MKQFSSYQVSDDVLNLLRNNLVEVAMATRQDTQSDWNYTDRQLPATRLFDGCTITDQGDGTFILERKNEKLVAVPGSNSDWVLFEGDNPSESTRLYLLSIGDPDIEICDWNTTLEVHPADENNIATVINKSHINGVPVQDSKFSFMGFALAFIAGQDGEMRGVDFIGNIVDGTSVIDYNVGSCRSEFLKVLVVPEGEEVPPVNILDRSDTIDTEGVDVVFEDLDPFPESLFFHDIIGAKNVSKYWAMPRLLINMKELR